MTSLHDRICSYGEESRQEFSNGAAGLDDFGGYISSRNYRYGQIKS